MVFAPPPQPIVLDHARLRPAWPRSRPSSFSMAHDRTDARSALPGLHQLLENAALRHPRGRIQMYPPGKDAASAAVTTTYASLFDQARANALTIQGIDGFRPGRPVLVHLQQHWDNILWFWSVVLSGAVPVMSTPFSQDADLRQRHILGLSGLLEQPICVTRADSVAAFGSDHGFDIHTVESLTRDPPARAAPSTLQVPADARNADALPAMLMLTSGSTGNAKAVKITYKQVLASVRGKSAFRAPPHDKPLLNWVGLDHVGSLVEIHLLAMHLGLDQIHVQPNDMVSSPLLFLDLISRHRVSRTFAPNFFLNKILSTIKLSGAAKDWDLSSLTMLVSGGEANDMETCVAFSELLTSCGAAPDALSPAFGMTETCAGSIYNLECPRTDIRLGRANGSLGRCVPGIEMRVTLQDGSAPGGLRTATTGEVGDLELRGDIVFEGYYRNEAATAEAILPGGWFRTGDQATIDDEGNLNLMGRVKDVVNINGVKISSADIQMATEKALGSKVAFVLCFPSRETGGYTEQVTVAYIPHQWPVAPEDVAAIHQSVVEASIVSTASRPVVFGLADAERLPLSTLGKVPRSKMRSLYEKGMFADAVELHKDALQQHRSNTVHMPTSELEGFLLSDVVDIMGDRAVDGDIGIDTSIFDLGFNSMDFIRLKKLVDKRLATEVPVITYLTSPTVRDLAASLSSKYQAAQCGAEGATAPAYDPIVPLLPQGSKTPLWLVHPGVGEVLVFIGLSHHMAEDDRPIYALRAPGFERGQEKFGCIEDAVTAYHAAITKKQPKGPYAIAGYSYGAMLAFEVAKRLESEGNGSATVDFVGSFNLPPHIKHRMRQLNWNMCLVNLASFLSLVPESYVEEASECDFPDLEREQALSRVLADLDKARMLELGLDEAALTNWAGVAYGLQGMAVDYEPSGSVANLDVFHAVPLKLAARSREDWLDNHLSKWSNFTRGDVKFHEVGGGHYTMMGPDYVVSFSETLRRALLERGL